MDVNVSVATASETASIECVPNNPQKIENTLRTELSLVNMSPRVTRRQRCALLAAAIENEIKHTVDGSVGVAKLAPFVAPSSETDASLRQHPPLTCPVAPGIENPITENKPNARLESSCAPVQTLSPKPFLESLADKQDIPVELESGSTDIRASGDSSIPNHQSTNPALLGKRIGIWPDPHPIDPIARATAPARDPTAAVPEVQTAPDAETEAIPAEVPNVFKRHGCRVKVLAAVATSVSLPSDKHSGPKVDLQDDNTEDLGIFLHNDEEWVDGALLDYPPSGQDSNFTKEHSVNPVVTDPLEPRARSKRKTRRLTTFPKEGGKEPPLKTNRQTVISPSRVDTLALRLPSGSDPTPPDSPKDVKTKQISFNETVKCWNPILQELTWRQIRDDVRGEVPLLKPVPKSKKKKSAVRRKKSKNPIELPNDDTEREADPMESGDVVEIDGICVPKSLKAPENLRPALKPAVQEPQTIADVIGSPVVTKPTDSSPRRKNKKRKSFLKNMTQLMEKYGEDFSYVSCLKVDGRFHCPDEECMDNNHRGYGAERALRNHIRIHHIDVPSPTCDQCGKSFATPSRVKEHMIVHSKFLPHPCKDCDKTFKTAALLKQHSGTHGGFGECFYCHKKFSNKRTLMNHFRNTPFRCDSCELSLHCPVKFAEHEKEVEHEYSCRLCPRTNRTQIGIMHHMRVCHYEETTANDGRFRCESCYRKFISWKNIYRHMRRRHPTTFMAPKIVIPVIRSENSS